MTHAPSFDELVELNAQIVGGASVVTNPDLLRGGLGRPFHTFDGKWLYPSTISQAGALLEGLIAAHGFGDGNKRTAWLATKTFLRRNEIPVRKLRHSVAANFVEGVALHNFSGDDVARWLADNLVGD